MQASHDFKPAASPEVSEISTAIIKTDLEDEVSAILDTEDSAYDLEGGMKRSASSSSMSFPLPPGALPPRKRAKTEDEKEQRRVERIMRNRQAAHASREKKRKHVEELEARCAQLESQSREMEEKLKQTQRSQTQTLEQNYVLQSKVEQFESAIQLARTSGDLSVLDSMPQIYAAPAQAVAQASVPAPVAVAMASAPAPIEAPVSSAGARIMNPNSSSASPEECASPEDLQLGFNMPALSHSNSNSPAADDDEYAFGFSFFTDLYPTQQQQTQTQTNPLESVGQVASLSGFSKAHHPAAMMVYA